MYWQSVHVQIFHGSNVQCIFSSEMYLFIFLYMQSDGCIILWKSSLVPECNILETDCKLKICRCGWFQICETDCKHVSNCNIAGFHILYKIIAGFRNGIICCADHLVNIYENNPNLQINSIQHCMAFGFLKYYRPQVAIRLKKREFPNHQPSKIVITG